MSHADSRTAARLTSLYEAHSADAFRYALHLTGRREDAEDVVQYVFLQAYASLEAGRELVNPRAWLMKATKHRSLNLIRDRRDTPAAEVRGADAFAVDPGEADALAGVRASLWSLPEPQHHAFVLRHWSGLSQDEIADVLSTTPGAVESLLVRARATLVAEHETPGGECASVRERLVRMLVPTPAHEAHLASCHRCRTAQTRLMRASGFAAALVPSPQVAHALAAAIPGFGASGAAAGAAATGAGASGVGAGGAAVSTASVATKAGILAKIAMVATTAAVAVTAVHPVRSAVTHALLGGPAPRAAASAVHHTPGAHSVPAGSANGHGAAAHAGGTAATGAGAGKGGGNGTGPGKGNGGGQGKGKGTSAGAPGNDAGKGKSGTAGSNGNGNGQGGSGAGGGNGSSASAPGRTKSAGSNAATGKGQGAGSDQGTGTTATAGSTGGAGTSNAGGNGKGNGRP